MYNKNFKQRGNRADMKYKVGETHYKYFMGQITKILDNKRSYASCAFNRAI